MEGVVAVVFFPCKVSLVVRVTWLRFMSSRAAAAGVPFVTTPYIIDISLCNIFDG